MKIEIKEGLSILKKNRTMWGAIIALVLLIFYNFTKLKMVNFDHLAFNNYNFMGTIKRQYEFTVMYQARPSFVSIITTAIEYLNVGLYWIWVVVFVLSIGVGIGLIIKELTSNKVWGFSIALLSICLYTISLEPISMPTAYAFVLGFGIVALLFSVYFVILYNKTEKYHYKLLSVVCVLLCMFNYEVGVLYIPVLLGINCWYLRCFNIKKNFQRSKEFIFAGLLYVIAFITIKIIYVGGYSGTQISGQFNPFKIAYSWFSMLITNIPGFFFFYNKSNAYKSPITYISNYGNKRFSFLDITSNYLSLSFVLQLILFGYLLNKAIKYLKVVSKEKQIDNISKVSMKWNILAAIMMIYSVIIPMLPSTLTTYTQEQITARYRLVGISNQYSYCFMMITFGILLAYSFSKISKKRMITSLLCSVLFMQFGMVAYTNEKNTQIIETEGKRFEQLDMIINDMAQIVGNESTIYAPSLFSGASPLSIPPFYFSQRFAYKTNKNIIVTADFDKIVSQNSLYYLRYLYTSDNKNTMFILSKVSYQDFKQLVSLNTLNPNAKPLSNNAVVYCFSSQKDFSLIGRVNSTDGSIVTITKDGSLDLISTYDLFQYKVTQTHKNSGRSTKIELNGNNLSLQSVAILPTYSSSPLHHEEIDLRVSTIGNTLSLSQIMSGYYTDGWIEKSAEFKIKTGKDGKVILNGYFPNEITGNETGTIYIDGERNLFKIEQASFTLELPAKAESVVTVKIENDFDYQAAATDTRKVSFILSDAQGK